MEQEGLFVDLRADSAPMERGFKRAADAADQMTRVIEARTRRIDDVCNRLNTTAVSALRSVASQIAGIGTLAAGGALTVDRIIRQADAWKQTSNQLALVTQGTVELRGAQDALFATAQKSRQAYGSVVDLYTRGAKAATELGASQDQLRRFAEGAALATSLGGKGAQEQAGAIQQLGQLLNSARVQAEEYNSVLDGSPRIAQAVADGLEAAGGSVGRLKRLIDDGKVSNREFFAAFLSQVPKIEAEFAKLTPTMADAGTVFDNALGRLIGRTDESIGATTMMARAIIDFSNDLEHAAAVAVAAGGALATVLVARGLGPMLPALVQGASAFATLAGQIVGAETAILRGADAATAYANVMPGAVRSSQMMAVETLSMARAEQAAAAARVQGLETARAEAAQLAAAAVAQRAEAAARYEVAQGIVTATGRRQVAAKALSEQNTATAAMIAHNRQLRAVEGELAAAIAAKAAADERAALAAVAHDVAMQKASLSARVGAAAMATLNGALSLVGGPVGAAILGVAGAIAFVATRSTEAERATEAFTTAQQAARDAVKDSSTNVDQLARDYGRLSESMKAVTALKLEEALQKQRDAVAALNRGAQWTVVAPSSDNPNAIVESNHGADNLPDVRAYERMGLAAQQVDRLRTAFQAFHAAAKDDPAAIATLVQVLDSVGREAGAAGAPLLDLARKLADPATKAEEAAQTAKELEARLTLLKNPADVAARAVLEAGRGAATAAGGFAQMGGAVENAVTKVAELTAKAKLLNMPVGFARRVAEMAGPEPEPKTPVVTGFQDRRTNSGDTAYQQYQAGKDVLAIAVARSDTATLKERTAEVGRGVAANRLLASALNDASKAQAQNRVELSKAALEYPGLGAETAKTILTTKDWGKTLATLPPELQALWRQMDASSTAQLSGEFAQLVQQTNLETASSLRLADAYGQGAAAVEAASRQVEIETRLLKLGEGARAQVTAMVNAEADARQRLELSKWVADTQLQIDAAMRLAVAEEKGGAAVAEANIQNKVAEELSRQRVATGTKEAGVIEAKIRALEGENRARRANAELKTANDDLAYARAELAAAQQIDEASRLAGERGLVTLRNQQQAARMAADIGDEAAQRWLALQEQIADSRALKNYADAVRQTADTIATDWAETLFDAMTLRDKTSSILDMIKALLRRIALEFLKTRLVMPVVTQIVGSAPSMFGISSPATAGGGSGMLGQVSNWGMSKAVGWAGDQLGVGQLYNGALNWAGDAFGFGTSSAAVSGAADLTTAAAGDAVMAAWGGGSVTPAMQGTGAAAETLTAAAGDAAMSAGGGLTSAGAGMAGALGSAGAGAFGGMLGGMIGTAANSKAVGGVAGAALGAGSAYLASIMGLSAMGGPVGLAIGAVVGGVMAMLGTQKKSVGPYSGANLEYKGGTFQRGTSGADNGGDVSKTTGLADSLATALNAIAAASGLKNPNDMHIGQMELYEQKGKYISNVGGAKKEFTDQASAVAAFLADALGLFMNDGATEWTNKENSYVAQNVRKALDASIGLPLEQMVANLTFAATDFARMFDGVGKAQSDDFSAQVEALSVSFQTARDKAAQLGLTTTGMMGSLEKATGRMFAVAGRAIDGLSAVDSINAAMESWRKSAVALMGAGLNPQPAMDLLAKQLAAIVNGAGDGIDGLQKLTEVASILRSMGEETGAVWAATRAEQVRAKVQQDLSMRMMAAQVQLGTVKQDAYDLTELQIKQAQELATVTDEAIRQQLVQVQAAERSAAAAKANAAAEAALAQQREALVQAGGDVRKWLDQRAGTASASVSPGEALDSAQAQFARDLALARGGNLDAYKRITETADRLLAATDAVKGSGPEYQVMERWVTSSLQSLPAVKGYDQQILEALQALGGSVNVQVELTAIRTITEQLSALSDVDKARLTQTAVILRTVEERVGRFLTDTELERLVDAATIERDIVQSLGRDLTHEEKASLVDGGDVLRSIEQTIGRALTNSEIATIVGAGTVERSIAQSIGRALTADERASLVQSETLLRVIAQSIGRDLTPTERALIISSGDVSRVIAQTLGRPLTAAESASIVQAGAQLRTVEQSIGRPLTATEQASIVAGGDVSRVIAQTLGRPLTAAESTSIVQAGAQLRTVEQSIGRALTADERAAIIGAGDVSRVIAQSIGRDLTDAERATLVQAAAVTRTVGQSLGRQLTSAELASLIASGTATRSVEQIIGRALTAAEQASLISSGTTTRSIAQVIGRDLTAAEVASLVVGGSVMRTVTQSIGRDLTATERAGLVRAATVIRSVEQSLGRSLTAAEQAQIILPGSVTRTIGQRIDPATGSPLITGASVTRSVTQAVETTETVQISRSIDDKLSAVLKEISTNTLNSFEQAKAIVLTLNSVGGLLLQGFKFAMIEILGGANGYDAAARNYANTIVAQNTQALLNAGAGLQAGGIVPGYLDGGLVANGVRGVDSVLARYPDGSAIAVAGGEFVTPEPAVNAETYPMLEYIRRHHRLPPSIAGYENGGLIDNRVAVPRMLIDAPAAVAASVDVQPVVTAINALTRSVAGLRADIADLGRADHSQRADLSAQAARKLDILADGIDRVARRVGG